MNIKIALVAFSLTFAGYAAPGFAQQNTPATVAVSKSQFNANITAYEQANGTNSQNLLKTLKGHMRSAIAESKTAMGQTNGSAAVETKMQNRINAYNTVVQKEKANDKSGVITALKAFANTL